MTPWPIVASAAVRARRTRGAVPLVRRSGMARVLWLAAWVALLGVLLRALVPAGYMPRLSPEGAGQIELVICTPGGVMITQVVTLDDDTTSESMESGPSCPFGLMASVVGLPAPEPFVLGLRVALAVAVLHPLGDAQAARPPATGPPLGSRAPPRFL